MKQKYHVRVSAQSFYIEEQSVPEQGRYVFAYTITIRNEGAVSARLLSRHWIITDSNGKVEEVRGEGVVGEQPYLRPGEGFQYTSGAVIETSVGSMQGSYQMVADDGVVFEARIPIFTLSAPRTLH
ncbi:MAG TPA: Co2+/Mg2+ efflux protein ApaG [Candidatus Competibacteraceae bacterium]|nr:Co2+/Mg2+ efflux protein ApaG [Candidatus Competibacteraceae bacterium]